jgi:hypothetical protein
VAFAAKSPGAPISRPALTLVGAAATDLPTVSKSRTSRWDSGGGMVC